MKPIPSTPETRRREVAQRCAERVAKPDRHWDDEVLARYRAVVDLGPDPFTEAIIAAQKAASGFTDLPLTVTCQGCERKVERVVTVGAEVDYDSATTDLCRECLVEAMAALDGAP